MQSSEPKSESHSFSPMTSRAVRPHNRSVGTDRLEQIASNRSLRTDRLEQIAWNKSERTETDQRERNKKSSQRNNPDTPQHSSRLHDVSMRS